MKPLHLPKVRPPQSVRARTIAAIKDATALGRGIGVAEIAEQTGIEPASVRHAVGNLLGQRVIRSAGGKDNARLYQFGPPASETRSETTTERYVPSRNGDYAGTELQHNPGLPPERWEAYAKPSRVGFTLRWRDGRITALDGGALPCTA